MISRAIKSTALVAPAYLSALIAMLAMPEASEQMAYVMFYAALAQAYNIFRGFTGYANFGYSAFLALGAYGMALGTMGHPKFGLILGALYSVFATLALGIVVGGVALRLRGVYFAIATIGVNEGLKYLILGGRIWGGADGLLISSYLREMLGEIWRISCLQSARMSR